MGAEFRPRREGTAPQPAAQAALDRALRWPGEIFASLADVPFASPYPQQQPDRGPLLEPGVTFRPTPGSPLEQAMHEGWATAEPDGAWALLDEQFLRFRTVAPVAEVVVSIWSFLPAERRQAITATAEGAAPATTGDLTQGTTTISLRSDLPKDEWEIRLSARTYRQPDADGGEDRRPLAYGLAALTTGPACSWRERLLAPLRRLAARVQRLAAR
jgi:hypothetical protein